MSLDDEAQRELAALDAAHRRRTPRVVDGAQGPTLTLDGRSVVNLSSNDYLSLAGDARLVKAAQAALAEQGSGSGASRLIAGTQRSHVELEKSVCDWMQTSGARLFNSGYAANVGVLSTLLRAGDVVLSDELNHASIIDGCRLSRATTKIYAHGDHAALERALAETPTVRGTSTRVLVVTESLFSMDGDVVDLAAISALAKKHGASLMVDEAHAVGARGPEGRGECAAQNVVPDVLVGTFGKALGGFGAFVATSSAIAELLWNRARSFVFSTALPASVPASALAAIAIVRSSEGQGLRAALASNARAFRAAVPSAGGVDDGAIAPILVGNDRVVIEQTVALLERGIYAQGIRPPTVPEGTARLRVSLASGHRRDQIGRAASEIRTVMSEIRTA
ncbi:MAG TPA: 8-amino-7-oxononanoate synthase [Kofleriaceae bacterium]|jgi:8-amino-7-oxononanoate synthase